MVYGFGVGCDRVLAGRPIWVATALRLVLGILSPFSASSPQSESLAEEKCTAGAVSAGAVGAALAAALDVVAVLDACESGLEVVATTDFCEFVEECAGGTSRRQAAVTVRIIRLRILIDVPSMIASA